MDQHRQTGVAVCGDDLSSVVAHLLRSATFSRSPRLREFLAFVGRCVVENRLHEINEYSLGIQVFGKNPDYNPNLDNIVRVTARQLRQKLAEYYAAEGVHDALRLSIPKGSYVPLLEPNTPAEMAEEHTPPTRSSRTIWALSAVALLALSGWGLAFWLWWRQPYTPRESAFLLKPLLTDTTRTTTVVLEDPILAKSWQMVGEVMTFNDFVAGRYLNPEYYQTGEGNALRKLLGDSYFVQFSALQMMQNITKAAESSGVHTTGVPCRTLAAEKMQNGNFVFVGGVGANPWVGEIQRHLAFEHRVEPRKGTRTFVNRSPRAAEPAIFESSRTSDADATYYTRVALLDNPFGSGRIALLGGTSRDATEAAGQFALSQHGVDEVRRLCGVPVDRLKGFELILETQSLAGTPVKRTVVAHRCEK